MDIGKEISHKIRDAIKAKLVDLGAYVDEELPDYIMVMIANKKTTEQMRDDLQLFLSNNTENFTSWLDTILQKLQSASSLTVDESLTTPAVAQKASTAQLPKKSRKSKDSKSSKSSKRASKESTREQPTEAVSSAVATEPESCTVQEEEPVRTDDPSQAIITLTPEMGDFDEELDPEPAEVIPPPEKPEKPSDIPSQETQVLEVTPIQRAQSSQPVKEVKSKRPIIKAPTQTEESQVLDDAVTVTHISTSPMSVIGERETFTRNVQEAPATYTATRKTEIHSRLGVRSQRSEAKIEDDDEPRKYMSVVGQVIDDEDDVDTLPATKQGLTSVVKPKRRPSLPLSKQANKSLLVRAMSDAQRSTINELERKRSTAVKIVRPSIQKKPLTRNLLSRAITDATMTEIQTRIQQNPRKRPDTDKLLTAGLVSKSKLSEKLEPDRNTNEYLSLLSPEDDTDDIMCAEQDNILTSVRHIDVEEEQVVDERVVRTTAKVTPVHVIKEQEILPAPVQKPVNNPRFIVTLAGADSMHTPKQKRAPKRARVRAQMPVIRTITNQNPEPNIPPYKATSKEVLLSRVTQIEEDEEYTFETEILKQGDVRGFAPRVETEIPMVPLPVQKTPKVDQVSFSLHDSEDDDDTSPSKKQKVLERCLFWPACKNGDACQYVHPTTKCVTFPKCKFGDKCLYIHPNCKFDAKCARSDCPYTHATRKQPATLPSPPVAAPVPSYLPNNVICKFHPGCQNPLCAFQHPKVCRFGGACTRPDCVFSHPKVVTGSALKWTKNVQKSSLLSSIPQHIAL